MSIGTRAVVTPGGNVSIPDCAMKSVQSAVPSAVANWTVTVSDEGDESVTVGPAEISVSLVVTSSMVSAGTPLSASASSGAARITSL